MHSTCSLFIFSLIHDQHTKSIMIGCRQVNSRWNTMSNNNLLLICLDICISLGVRPYKCEMCEKAFTQRCSLESHCRKVHNVTYNYTYKERRAKMYVCEECGHTTADPEEHFEHLQTMHPHNPALARGGDKRQFKFGKSDGRGPGNTHWWYPHRTVNLQNCRFQRIWWICM